MSRKPIVTRTPGRHLKRRIRKHPPTNTTTTKSVHAPPPPPTHAPPTDDDESFDNYFDDYADDGNDPFDMHVLRRRFPDVQRQLLNPYKMSSYSSSSGALRAYHALYDAELAYLQDLNMLKTQYVSPMTLYCEKKGHRNPFVGLPLDRVQQLNVGFLHDIRHAVELSSRNGTRLLPLAFVLSTFLVPGRMRHYTTYIGMLEVVVARIEGLMGSRASVEDFLDIKAQRMWASYQKNAQARSVPIGSSGSHYNKQPASFSLISMVRRPQKRIKEYQKLVSRLLGPPRSSKPDPPSGREFQLLKMVQANLKAAVAVRRVSNARDASLAELSKREGKQSLRTARGKITSTFSRLFGSSGTSSVIGNEKKAPAKNVKMTAKDVRKFNEKKFARSQKGGWREPNN